MREYSSFHRQLVNPSVRELPGPIYGAAAEFPWQHVAWAIVRAAYMCPAEKLKNRMCSWITPAEITALGKEASGPEGKAYEKMRVAEIDVRGFAPQGSTAPSSPPTS